MIVCSIITNITVGERGAELSSELASLAGRRVRGNGPDPGVGGGNELRPRLQPLCLDSPPGPALFRGHPTLRPLRADVRRVPLSGSRGDPAQCCQRPGGEAEVSAGPEAPRGSGSPIVPSPPRGPRRLPVRGDSPPLGSREPWERGARGGVPGSRGAVRASTGPGSVGERRGEGGGGAGGGARPPRGARPERRVPA